MISISAKIAEKKNGLNEETAVQRWTEGLKMANEKCLSCKFWLWFEKEHGFRCSIKGCWNGSKFVEYKVGKEDGK
jgi:hypothetical protein